MRTEPVAKSWTGTQVNLVLLFLLAGLYLPSRMGIEFLDPLTIVPYSLIGLVFVSGSAGAVFEDLESYRLLRARVWRIALGGLGYAVSVLGAGVIMVNIGFWHGEVLLPPVPICLATVWLIFSLSALVAAVAAHLMRRHYTSAEVKSRLLGTLLAVLLAWVFRSSLVPVALREWIAPVGTTAGLTSLIGGIGLAAIFTAEWLVRGNMKEL
jgi:hypothetical protein